MLVVITIIGLIMALVGPRVLNYLGESKIKAARIQIESFESSLDLFYLDAGRYPSTVEGLTALVRRPAGLASWSGPYLKSGTVPSDPWGRPYAYKSPGEHGAYDIISYGAGGQGGADGAASIIASWTR
jgi:general secretion pathway protein G